MEQINIQFTLFSAFYSPLICTIAGPFLKDEGLTPDWSVAAPGVSAISALENGTAHVVQSALSQGFGVLEQGQQPTAVHFAQINEMDGFFLTGRDADPDFSWNKLEGADVILFGGGQPLAMFKYACHKAGINYEKINALHVGNAVEMDKAFRSGIGQYIQQQGPFPQQLEADGVGHIVGQVGTLIGPCGFSSLAAKTDWLASDMAGAFMRAYRNARHYINDAPAAEIAKLEKPFFPKIEEPVLAKCIKSYQQLGCWTPHVEITQDAFDATVDIFAYNGRDVKKYTFDQICAPAPVG
ncbi:ABC transporter substrate-binding protein [Sneathiella sp.]|jgi:NitT/TauT family transport system substrate-binding protein|uniref:ABC transporter substrate-binding protein n=1 Tax=Sneathiella sp. TaxID=1964365 RepID=UPI0039E710A3